MRARGFTIIELLVVLVVLSAVAGMVVLSAAPLTPERTAQKHLPLVEEVIFRGISRAKLYGQDHGLIFSDRSVSLYALALDESADQPEWELEEVARYELPDSLQFRLTKNRRRVSLPGFESGRPNIDDIALDINPDGTTPYSWTLNIHPDGMGAPWFSLVSDGVNAPEWGDPDEQ